MSRDVEAAGGEGGGGGGGGTAGGNDNNSGHGEGSTETAGSPDEEVEHFFEGLDEDAFIANLQVVSAWDSDGEAEPNNTTNTQFTDNTAQPTGTESPRHVPSPSPVPAPVPAPAPTPTHQPTVAYTPPVLGTRRDPDKTKRDIEKDKANKSKEHLIKKMETGLIPPGMEMDLGPPDPPVSKRSRSPKRLEQRYRERDRDRNKPCFPKRKPSPDFQTRQKFRRSPPPHHSFHGREFPHHFHEKPYGHKHFPFKPKPPPAFLRWDRYRDESPPPSKRRPDASREISHERSHERSREKTRERSRTRSRSGSRERYHDAKYRSYSRESSVERHRKSARPKEDFMTFISKQNLNSPKFSNPAPSYDPYHQQAAPVMYPPQAYLPNPIPYIPVGPPPVEIPQLMPNYALGPDAAFNICPPPYEYSNRYENRPRTFIDVTNMSKNTNMSTNMNMSTNTNTNMSTNTNTSTNINSIYCNLTYNPNSANKIIDLTGKSENLYNPFHESDEKAEILKKCDTVVKSLNNPLVINHFSLASKEDINQRDSAFSTQKKETAYSSPLNRDSSDNYYNFTSTGDKSKLLVPIIISTVEVDKPAIARHEFSSKSIGTQTVLPECDKCQCRALFLQETRCTQIYSLHTSKSVHSQVNEEDLVSSKMIFTPNQNSKVETPPKPVSLTHMTPAQILVAELTAKAKSFQRTETFRHSGTTIQEQATRFKAAYEEMNERKFPGFQAPKPLLFQPNNYKMTKPVVGSNTPQKYGSDSKKNNKNNRNW